MTIKTREPGAAFLKQVAAYTPKAKKSRPWREINSDDEDSMLQTELVGEAAHETEQDNSTSGPILGSQEPDTNRAQTGHKRGGKPDTNRAQTGHAALTPKTQTGHKPDTQPDTRVDTNWTQTAHKLDTKARVTELVGLQRKLVILVYRSCQIARARISDPLTIEHVAASLEIPMGSVKTSFRRLEDKCFIKRQSFKNGRGGWAKFELPDDVFNALLQLETEHKLDTNRAQTGYKPDTQPDTQPDTTPSSSSSYINNNNLITTTAENARARLNEWTTEDLDYSMLSDIGFGRSQAGQLRSLGLSFDIVQRSLVYFDFELRYTASGKTIQEPLALLMKRMRQNGCWDAPEEYEKRQAHFRDRFSEREQELKKSERQGAAAESSLEVDNCPAGPFAGEHGGS